MSLGNCIPGLVKAGKLTKKQGDEAQLIYDRHYRRLVREMGPAAAAAEASERALAEIERVAMLKKRRTLLQISAQKKLLAAVRGGDGRIVAKRLPQAIVRVEARRKAIEGRSFAMIDGILARHRATVTGRLRRPAELDDIVRELFGTDSGNLNAREMADAWRQAGEYLRRRFNASGGAIGKLEGWGLPQAHDSRAVRHAAGPDATADQAFEAWRDFTAPLLDRKRMIDDRTGAPFDDAAIGEVLRDVFDTIRSDGWAKRTPGAAGGKMLASRNAEHRFLHFADADGWLAYQAKFGKGSAFDAMMGHVRGMSRDIAAIEHLGPNPEATVRWLGETAEAEAKTSGDAAGRDGNRAHAAAVKVGDLWNEYTGALHQPVNRNLALVGGAYRSIQTSAKLGSAVISASSDLGYGMTTRAFNGMPVVSILRDYLKLLNPASDADRRLAVRLGLGAEGWSTMIGATNRYLMEEFTGETARRLSNGVLRASGLIAWTDAGRWANGIGWLGHLTDESVKTWEDLGAGTKRALQRYGMGAEEWDKIRSTPLEMDGGVPWIKPMNIEDQALGDKVLEMIHSETDFAVPVADLETRALMNSIARPGTVAGELIRSGPLLFKSFGIAVALRHLGRAMEMPTLPGKIGYLAALTVPMTIMGGLTLWLRDMIANGKDPRPANDAKFWAAAAIQGGGFGMAGDVLKLTTDPRLDSAAGYIGGPLAQDALKLGQASYAGVAPAFDGSDKAARAQARVPWKAAQLARDNLPGGTLWYSRLAFNRLVMDQIQAEIDPDYREHVRRGLANARKQGQGFYWAPGETAPARGPDVANVVTGAPVP
jgi:hypothetical protein